MVAPQPRVLAVLVTHDGASWLPEVLDGLQQQTYEALDVVAVDNGSQDGSLQILLSQLDETAVMVAERDLGFGGAVSFVLDARPDADLVLLVHDDLVLHPDAVTELVAAIEADESLAAVGCKLLDYQHDDRLQSVGWSVDLSGRADLGLEADERDQGQRDDPRRPLVVSSAGMLLRREIFDAVGRFDRRYHLFRDDLDLCWRLWLAGWDVEVVPSASGRHVRAASNFRRLGQTVFLGARYFAERNTLATLLKNYSAPRLLLVLPVFFVVGVAKLVGFVATRRLSDAWQTLRAWVWNLAHLPSTISERRAVRQFRQRSDRELRPLFVRVVPRMRAYVEAMGDWLTGGDLPEPITAEHVDVDEPPTATRRILATVRRHPIAVTGALLVLVGLVVGIPLLQAGPIRGGDIAPFPESGTSMLEDYMASWHDASGLGTSTAPSPAQGLLGSLQLLTFGRSYLIARLLLLGAVPIAWLFALRASALLAPTRGPRVAAATLYALSPAALLAIRTGQLGAIVLFAMLPALAIGFHQTISRRPTPARAWRAAASTVLVSSVIIAFEPSAVLALGLALVVMVARVLLTERTPWHARSSLLRIAFVAVGVFAVLFPWSLTWFTTASPIAQARGVAGAAFAQPLWEYALQLPVTWGPVELIAGAGVLVAGLFGLAFARDRWIAIVVGLWAVAIGSAVLAAVLGRLGADAWLWPHTPLIVLSAALSGAFVVGLKSFGSVLSDYDFGWRHASVGLGLFAVVGAVAAAVYTQTDDPWAAYAIDEPALPQFIGVDAEPTDYRVLTVSLDEGTVSWDVTAPQGPTILSVGVAPPDSILSTIDESIEAIVGGSDPGAAGRLALLNIRYVVVPEDGRSEELDRALSAQLDLEPVPVASGLVFEVAGVLPRVSFVPAETVESIRRRGALDPGVPSIPLSKSQGARWAGPAPRTGAIIVSEANSPGWEATLDDGTVLERQTSAGLIRFDVPEATPSVTVQHDRQAARSAAVTMQLLALFLVLSLLLRPPAFATRGADE